VSQSVEFFGNFALEGAGRTPTLRRKRRRHPRRLTGNARHHDRRQRRGHLFSVYQEISQGRRRQRSKRFYHRCLLEVLKTVTLLHFPITVGLTVAIFSICTDNCLCHLFIKVHLVALSCLKKNHETGPRMNISKTDITILTVQLNVGTFVYCVL